MKCEYCQKQNFEDIVCETKFWIVALSYDQTYLGRCFVISKRHCSHLSELSENEILDFLELVKSLESSFKKSFDAIMFNWTCLMNNAYLEKNPNPHLHWHFRPRYNHKVEFAGSIFEDNEFGKHYIRGIEKKMPKEIMNKIIEKLNLK